MVEEKRALQWLNVHESQKFNTNSVMLAFVQKAKEGAASRRALLSYLMAVSSNRYQKQQAVAKRLMALYGASFSVRVQAYGQLNLLLFNLSFVKKSSLPDSQQGIDDLAMTFFKEMVFNQNWQRLVEQPELLAAEKKNLQHAILNRQDDKVALALDEARTHLFADQALRESILGRVDEVAALTVADIEAAYAEMVEEDDRLLYVHGEMSEEQVAAFVQDWPKRKNNSSRGLLVKRPELRKGPLTWLENADFQQAVTLAHYQLEEGQQNLAVALIFNALLGAGPASLLFTEIREKRSLAYQISSRLQWDLGMVTVLGECAKDSAREVLGLVDEQMERIARGDFSTAAFDQAKKTVLAARLRLVDDLQAQSQEGLLRRLLPGLMAEEDLLKALDSVGASDLQDFAFKLKKVDSFIMAEEEGK
ncbi:M16 family metallopeptidase [Fructobacillus papyrifericola]|uniref:Insulinase family protein n=1 Tax=Fructobacillus papyrifericola TaxID=2713172 RepID=A0ABS5QSU8_9LACO|nr:insulinase family protein [Fructobacillus papyrifericola]MBS9336274.1 insulinase family protein [Fructobacillus papyrifericola]